MGWTSLVLFVALWAAFAYQMSRDPRVLEGVWRRISGLHVVLRVVIWIILLPWMVALYLWTRPWPRTSRIVAMTVLAIAWTLLFLPT